MKKGNLLLIDDEIMIIENLQLFLESYADNIFIANDGRQALEILQREDIQCIVCDINMPHMNGLEFIKQVREDGREVPIIFYTAYNSSEILSEAVKYGAFDFLTKPNLDGVEDVVIRGLAEGVKRKNIENKSPEETQNELQDLLKKI